MGNNIDGLLSDKDYKELKRTYNDFYDFGYYLAFMSDLAEVYFYINEKIMTYSFNKKENISRNIKVSVESHVNGNTETFDIGRTSNGDIVVDEDFYSDPSEFLSHSNKLSEIFK